MIRFGRLSLGTTSGAPICGALICGALIAAAAPSMAVAASLVTPCHKPKGDVATTICASPEYRAMEREIAALTDRAKTQLSPGERSQLVESAARFVRQRKGCAWAAHNSAHPGAAIDECIRASLEGRVKRLRDVVDRKSSEVSSR